MHSLYFAYGSNLASARMRKRVPGAQARGTARLEGWRLATDKPGADGSAKANLVRDAGAHVWGALWEIDDAGFAALDRCERDYERIAVAVATQGGGVEAWTYFSRKRTDDLALRSEYKAWIVAGAAEHGLPSEWQRLLATLPER